MGILVEVLNYYDIVLTMFFESRMYQLKTLSINFKKKVVFLYNIISQLKESCNNFFKKYMLIFRIIVILIYRGE